MGALATSRGKVAPPNPTAEMRACGGGMGVVFMNLRRGRGVLFKLVRSRGSRGKEG